MDDLRRGGSNVQKVHSKNSDAMKFLLQDTLSTYWIRKDIVSGYVLTTRRKDATIFDRSLEDMRETVKYIYCCFHHVEKPRKIFLLVEMIKEKE